MPKRSRRSVFHSVRRMSQGSTAETPWTVARMNFVAQLAIRFRILDPSNLEKLKVGGELPEYFQETKLPELHKDQVCWFNGTHTNNNWVGIGSSKVISS